jgi:hypothetical protein
MTRNEQAKLDGTRRRWNWIAFAAGLLVGIPLGAHGLVVLMQILVVVISP